MARSQGEPIIFLEGDREIAVLTPSARLKGEATKRRLPGQMRGRLEVIVEDDEHLEGFKDYLP